MKTLLRNPEQLRQSCPKVDEVMVQEQCAGFAKRSIKKESKLRALKLAISMMDLTTLEGKDTPGKLVHLCSKAITPFPGHPDVPSCAAVCVYPTLVKEAKHLLRNSSVKVASVATAFPSGMTPLKTKLAEVRMAVNDGADEIDMVINRSAFLQGNYAQVADEIAQTHAQCKDAHLKVILETGEIGSLDHVRLASEIAMRSGADFIKTSTGKITPAATPAVTLVMLEAIRDYFYETGVVVGMKPAGGIRSAKEALAYLVMLHETLGERWMTPEFYRFGASTLANDVLMQIGKELFGSYQRETDYALP
jgi:deoxyribose-phosphate aldolase